MDPLEITGGLAIGEGLGGAISDVVIPRLQNFKNAQWAAHTDRPLDAGKAAEVAAEEVDAYATMRRQASYSGFDADRFADLYRVALTAPGIGTLLELLRRSDEQPIDFEHGLRKAKLGNQWDDALRNLRYARLGAPVIALAIVRGIMGDPGFLPVGPPTTEGKVAAFPVSPLDALAEARAAGIDRDRLFIETAIAGRPMGPEAAASAVFRGILEHVDYQRAVAEGDVRNEWAEAIFETSRQIPSVADYVALHLRGHTDAAGMHDGAARHGMSAADADRIYLARGRPAAPGQMATAAARGIDGPAGRPMDREQFLLGIAESDIRPEWGPMLWEARYLYPPLFQLTRLVQAGAVDADTAREWARKDRYPPEVVTALHTYWLTLDVTKASPWVTKANNQLWTTTHRSYVAEESDDAAATGAFDLLAIPATDQAAVFVRWQYERSLRRAQLSPSDIRKAFQQADINAATGVSWKRDEALAALMDRGWSMTDADSFLNIPYKG